MSSDRPRTRLHCATGLDGHAAPGLELPLDGDQAHYLRGVLRQAPGDTVLVFAAAAGEWLAQIATLTKNAASVRLIERTRAPVPVPDLWLAFAPLKAGRTEYVVEKATELGVARLKPVLTRRGDVGRVNLDRLRANAAEAAQQCERTDVPLVDPLVDLSALLAAWDAGRALLVAAEAGPARPLLDVVRERGDGPAALLIGPEGGFDPEELALLAAHPFVVPVGLGPRILRADTAAFAALALWQAAAGDWVARPAFR